MRLKLLQPRRNPQPSLGPGKGKWGELLKKLGVAERTARDYMKLAGYVEVSAKLAADNAQPIVIPTYSQAGISKPIR